MYEDDGIGGLPGTIGKMMSADPNCGNDLGICRLPGKRRGYQLPRVEFS